MSEFLVVLTNAVEGQDDAFNDWYTNRHVPDVLQLPGVLAAQRYEFIAPGPSGAEPDFRYLALYEIEDGAAKTINENLREAAEERDRVDGTSEQPRMPISPALAEIRVAYWVRSITDRMTC